MLCPLDCDPPHPKFHVTIRPPWIRPPDMSNAFFSDLLASISERGRTLLAPFGIIRRPSRMRPTWSNCARRCCRAAAKPPAPRWRARCSTATSHLDDAGRLSFFEALARNYGPDREKLAQAIEAWRAQPSDDDASDLHFASEPRRQELIRRLNRAPGGTSALVAMRADLLVRHEWPQGSRRARPRRRAFAVFLVQQGVSRAAQDRLVDAGQHSGTDHPLRGGA